ncbi:Lead [Klebsiella michiganensis]|uniref:Lead n=1 Tax=Klebsiella michiganensis TaxID=1134687 RepID=A0A7H4PG72_9ENTR|nr:Lead [Klebsiella michiganensis]
MIEVAAGGRLPADGQLLSPFASFDESALTGESVPVERNAGERVAAGATSVDRLVQADGDLRTGRQRYRSHP